MLLDPRWADEETDTGSPPSRWRKYLWAGLAILMIGGLTFVLRSGMFDVAPSPAKQKPVIITVLPPPPPPPPPKAPERPPEPQKLVEPKPTQQPQTNKPPPPKPAPPKQVANDAPKGQPLQSRGPAGEDAFGLRAGSGEGNTVGGGGGEGPGNGGLGNGYYAAIVQSQLQAAITRDARTRRGTYRSAAELWLSSAGRVERVELMKSSGNADLDASLVDLLRSQTISQPPPAGVRGPIKITISARG